MQLPPHRCDLTPATQHRTTSTAVFRDPSSASSCFRRRFSTQFFLEHQTLATAATDSLFIPGRMPLEAGVLSQGM